MLLLSIIQDGRTTWIRLTNALSQRILEGDTLYYNRYSLARWLRSHRKSISFFSHLCVILLNLGNIQNVVQLVLLHTSTLLHREDHLILLVVIAALIWYLLIISTTQIDILNTIRIRIATFLKRCIYTIVIGTGLDGITQVAIHHRHRLIVTSDDVEALTMIVTALQQRLDSHLNVTGGRLPAIAIITRLRVLLLSHPDYINLTTLINLQCAMLILVYTYIYIGLIGFAGQRIRRYTQHIALASC